MNKRISSLLRKEFLEFKRDLNSSVPLLLLPIVFGCVIPVVISLVIYNTDISLLDGRINSVISNFSELYTFNSSGNDKVMLLRILFDNLFLPLFILIPTTLSLSTAALSFVSEKENKTLESILYTPLTNREFILGKLLFSLVPSVVLGWLSIGLYAFLVQVLSFSFYGEGVLSLTKWLIVCFPLIPLVTVLSILLIFFVSLRVETVKSAISISSLLVLPIIFIFISQVTGLFIFNSKLIILVSIPLFIIDCVAYFVMSKFDRELLLLGKQTS